MQGHMPMMEVVSWAHAVVWRSAQPLPHFQASAVFDALETAGVAAFYPGFRSWFFGKVVPGLETGEREIAVAFHADAIVGVAISKRSAAERKLCTLWVPPSARGNGVAGALARSAFEWLGTERPLFTVPEERMPEFAGLIRNWRFAAPRTYGNVYRAGRAEFVFNGVLGRGDH